MEKADNVKVFAADFGWSDVGTWSSLYELRKKDEKQNVVFGNHVKMYDTGKCIVHIPKRNKVVVIQGLDDYIVADSDNVLLICKKSEEQQIRQYVTDIQVDFGKEFV